MSNGWAVAIILLPGAVFRTRVPVGLCVVIPVALLEAALEVVLIR